MVSNKNFITLYVKKKLNFFHRLFIGGVWFVKINNSFIFAVRF